MDLSRGVPELTKEKYEDNNSSEQAYMEQTLLSVCSLLMGAAKMFSSISLTLDLVLDKVARMAGEGTVHIR